MQQDFLPKRIVTFFIINFDVQVLTISVLFFVAYRE